MRIRVNLEEVIDSLAFLWFLEDNDHLGGSRIDPSRKTRLQVKSIEFGTQKLQWRGKILSLRTLFQVRFIIFIFNFCFLFMVGLCKINDCFSSSSFCDQLCIHNRNLSR